MGDPKTLSYRQRWGLWAALRFGLMWRLRDWLGFYVYGVYLRELMPPSDHTPREVAGFRHRVFEAADMAQLLPFACNPELDLSEAFIRQAFLKGDACNAVLLGDRLVSYHWMAFTPTHDECGVFVDFHSRHRYSYKAFTLPEFRGLRTLRLFMPFSDGYCLSKGRRLSISFIAVDNQASIRHALGMGNRCIGYAGYWRIGSWFLPFRSRGVRQEGFRFFLPRQG